MKIYSKESGNTYVSCYEKDDSYICTIIETIGEYDSIIRREFADKMEALNYCKRI